MKPISPLSTALAGAVLLAPFWSPDNALAIDIKVRPAVKVQPKIAVKPRIKVSPKVVVKPKVKVAPKIAIKPKVNPAIKPKMAVTPTIQVPSKAIKPRIAVTPKVKAVPLPAPRVTAIPTPKARIKTQPKPNIAKASPARPTVPLPASAGKGGKLNTPNLSNKLGNAALEAGARESAAAAEAVRNLGAMKDLRDSATANLGLDTPDLGGDGPLSNQERLGGAGGNINHGNFGFGDDLGGSTTIPGPQNSHQGNTPPNPFAVTPESIAGGMAGANGQVVIMPTHERTLSGRLTTVIGDRPGAFGGRTTRTIEFYSDGTERHITDRFHDFDGNGTRETHDRTITNYDRNGNQVGDVVQKHDMDNPANDRAGKEKGSTPKVAELRDPDYVGGNPDCWGIDCVLGPSEPPSLGSQKHSANQVLPASPENANPNGTNGTPAVSQDQLLSRYDSDFTSDSGTTPITPKGACQDC